MFCKVSTASTIVNSSRPSQPQTDFGRQPVALAIVARRTRRHDIVPRVSTTPGNRENVVPGKELPALQLTAVAATILTAIPVASEEECIRDLPAKPPRHLNEAHQANNSRIRNITALGAKRSGAIGFQDLCLVVQHQADRAPSRKDRQRLERGVQGQASHLETYPYAMESCNGPPGWAARRHAGRMLTLLHEVSYQHAGTVSDAAMRTREPLNALLLQQPLRGVRSDLDLE